MKAKIILAILFLVGISARSASAQGILPPAFGGWVAASQSTQVPAEQIEQFANENAAVLREYGVGGAERREFTQGPQTITVTLYKMTDPSAAYGAFTFLREPSMTSLVLSGASPYTAGSRDRVLIVAGNLLVELSLAKAQPEMADLSQLTSALASHADTRPFPRIADFLPQESLVRGSERYLLGPLATAQSFAAASAGQADWIGFDKSAEAMVAHYRFKGQAKGQEAAVLIVIYPTQQIAADQYGAISKRFALNADPADAGGRPIVFGTRQSALIALVTGIESREAANRLLSQVHYSSTITWNEPSFELKDPSIATIVIGAFMDTGLIMVVAIAAGLGFGGFRLFMKLLLPGRVFDRRKDVEILQLGLGSKPIDVEEFYR